MKTWVVRKEWLGEKKGQDTTTQVFIKLKRRKENEGTDIVRFSVNGSWAL
jgi:hypothetical protein